MTYKNNINIWIEGLQGSGKSTLLQELVTMNPQLKVCREGDYSPVELAWCAWLTKEQYDTVLARYEEISEEIKQYTVQEGDRYIVMYTRILTDILIVHLKHRQELELRIVKEVVGEQAIVLPSKQWTREMLKFDTDTV